MQYVLTAEEMAGYRPKAQVDGALNAAALLRGAALEAAGVKCVHDTGSRISYCDECPVGRLIMGQPSVSDETWDEMRARRDALCPRADAWSK